MNACVDERLAVSRFGWHGQRAVPASTILCSNSRPRHYQTLWHCPADTDFDLTGVERSGRNQAGTVAKDSGAAMKPDNLLVTVPASGSLSGCGMTGIFVLSGARCFSKRINEISKKQARQQRNIPPL
jgi:hypothetical protein